MTATPADNPSEEGASPKELLLEAARRNNTDLLEEVLGMDSTTTELLNKATDALGNTALHVAAQYGSLEIIDQLLDVEGLEVDAINRLERDTPLHKACQYARGEKAHGLAVVEMLTDAGADPRIRNKAKQRPVDIVDPRDTDLVAVLRKAEYLRSAGNDVVAEDDDDDAAGSGSGSDEE